MLYLKMEVRVAKGDPSLERGVAECSRRSDGSEDGYDGYGTLYPSQPSRLVMVLSVMSIIERSYWLEDNDDGRYEEMTYIGVNR